MRRFDRSRVGVVAAVAALCLTSTLVGCTQGGPGGVNSTSDCGTEDTSSSAANGSSNTTLVGGRSADAPQGGQAGASGDGSDVATPEGSSGTGENSDTGGQFSPSC